MMMKARCTTMSASATSASTASRSRMSPCRYSALVQPCAAGSNGLRAMPTTRSTSGCCSNALTADMPMSPVGPVTATVHAMSGWMPAVGAPKHPNSALGERLLRGVVAGNEGDAGPAVAARTAEVEAVDRDRLVDIAFRAGSVGADLVGMDQPMAVVAAGGTEHRAHVLGRECRVPDDDVLEVRRQLGDLVDHPLAHLDLHIAVAGLAHRSTISAPRVRGRKPQRERRRGVLARRRQVGVVDRRNLQRDRRIGGDDAAPAVLPLLLEFFGSAENADVRLHFGIVEHFVGLRELRYTVQREVHLQVAAAVVGPREALADVGGHRVRIDKAVDREVRRNAGYDNRRGDRLAALEADSGGAAIGHQDLVDLAAQPQFTAVRFEQLLKVCGEGADAAA